VHSGHEKSGEDAPGDGGHLRLNNQRASLLQVAGMRLEESLIPAMLFHRRLKSCNPKAAWLFCFLSISRG
jgi:hypothetical protein